MHRHAQPTIPARRGYQAFYRPDEVNHCPGCAAAQWIVGRMVAECAFCGTAVPLITGGTTGPGLFRLRRIESRLVA